MKICIATLAIGKKYQLICAPGTRSKRRYAKKHGYDFVYETSSLDPSRPPAWSKILLVEKLLPHYDWVFWADADTFIMNDETKLESFIEKQYLFIGSEEIALCPINTGVFFIKNSPKMYVLLKDIYSRTHHIHHSEWEQTALIEILNEKDNPYSQEMKFLPQRKMNSYHPESLFLESGRVEAQIYEEGDFLLHLVGERGALLFFLMRKYGWNKSAFSLLLFLAKRASFLLKFFHPRWRKAHLYFQRFV